MFYRALVCVLILLWLPAVTLAEPFQFQDIVVEGSRRVDLNAIRAVLSVRPGTEATMADIDRDLRAIFALGHFDDVEAAIEERNGRQTLVYRIVERPLVRSVQFSGNKQLSSDKLRPLITFRTPSIHDPQAVDKTIAALRQSYLEEGYYGVEIEPRLEVGEEREATLTFDIREGQKVLIRSISFEGNRVISERRLRKAMETRERWLWSWLTGRGIYKEEVVREDMERIADLYYNEGYVQVRVRQPRVTLSEDRKYLTLHIEIEEGVQFQVGEIKVQGDLLEGVDDLLKFTKLREGQIFSRARLRDDVATLNTIYADRGYAYVNVAPMTHIEPEARRINLVFDIEQGIQVAIEHIRITGNNKTRDKVIRREMPLAETDLYSATLLRESRRRVHNLGFFEEVNITTSPGAEEGLMNVDVEVKERPTGTFSVGIGYSSVDGALAQGSVTQENFLGRALKLNLAGSFGKRSTTYQVGITDPYFLDYNLTVGFDLYNTEREWTDFTRKATGGNLKVGFPVARDVRAFFLYRYEEKTISDISPTASLLIREQEGDSTISSLYSSLTRNTTDYRLDPTRGSVSEVSIEFAGLGGTEKFSKYILDYRHFFPMPWGTVISAHGQIGYVQEIGGRAIPIDERFFLGGISTLRGFRVREVGPRIRQDFVDAQGNIVFTDFEYIGGNKQAHFNLEYLFPLIRDAGLKGVLFFDAGNAWSEDEDYFQDLRYSTGAGIRWLSPLGPLRLEWGYNLDPREMERRSQFEFSIGRFF
jgi:outer membrane protein insertion porin family